MKRRIFAIAMTAVLCACSEPPQEAEKTSDPVNEADAPDGLEVAEVNGVEIHYKSKGSGETIVFVHGSFGDYREWWPVIVQLPNDYRKIAYSRRYNYPNRNPIEGGRHSPLVEARDLGAFIREISDEPVHLAGASYGAFTALVAALEHPELVRTLTIVEPPMVNWLPDIPGGVAEYERVYSQLIAPSAAAFRAGHRERALRAAMDFFAGPESIDQFPEEVRERLRANLKEWKAIVLSSEPFPPVRRAEVKNLDIPVLMISGGQTYPFLELTDAELERVLTDPTRKIVSDATHDVCIEVPNTCATAIREHVETN